MLNCCCGRGKRKRTTAFLCVAVLVLHCLLLSALTSAQKANQANAVGEEEDGFIPPHKYKELPQHLHEETDPEDSFLPKDQYKEIPDWNTMEDNHHIFELNSNLDTFAHFPNAEELPASSTVLSSARDEDEDQAHIHSNNTVPGFGFDYTITWVENFEKKESFLQMINLAFVHGLMDNFQEDVLDTLYDLKEPFLVPFQLQCTKEIYFLDDFNGLLSYLHFVRLFQTRDFKRHWNKFQEQEQVSQDPNWNPFDHEHQERLFDTLERLEDEIKIFVGMESRLADIANEYLASAVADLAEEDAARTCTLTYLAVIRDLRSLLVDLLRQIDMLSEQFCFFQTVHMDADADLEEIDHEEAEEVKQAKADIAAHRARGHAMVWQVAAQHLSKHRYRGVEPVGYEYMTQLYIRDALIHYFHDGVVCEERQELIHRNYSEVIVNVASEYEVVGEQRQAQIVVMNHVVSSHVRLDECVSWVSSMLHINLGKMYELVQHCAVVRRKLYLYDGSEPDDNEEEESSPEKRAAAMDAYHTDQLDEIASDWRGHKALISKEMACLIFYEGMSAANAETEVCVPYGDEMTLANRAAVMHAAGFSPEVFEAGQQYPQPYLIQNPDYVFKTHSMPVFGADGSISSNDGSQQTGHDNSAPNLQTEPPYDELGNPLLINPISLLSGRALILGIGGETHSFLLAHFPYLVVDSVELNVDMVRVAWEELGFSSFVCEVLQYQPRTKSLEVVTPYFTDASSEKHRLESLIFVQKHRIKILPHDYYLYEELYKHDLHEEEEDEYEEDHQEAGTEEQEAVHEESAERISVQKRVGDAAAAINLADRTPPEGRRRLSTEEAEAQEEEVPTKTASQHKRANRNSLQSDPQDANFDTEEDDDEYRCRSNVIIADAWGYVEFVYTKVAEQENEVKEDLAEMRYPPSKIDVDAFQKVEYYDYVFIDTLDEFWIHWPAKPYEHLAMNNVDRLASSLTMLKSILRPFTGIAAIRVVRDISYQFLYQKVVSIFRAAQVMVVELSTTEALFLVSRDRFMEEDVTVEEWICEEVANADNETVEQCRPKTAEEKRTEQAAEDAEDNAADNTASHTFSYSAINVEKLIKRSDRFRAIPHPCETESDISHDIGYLGLDLGFSYLTSLGLLTGINCQPMQFVPPLDYEAAKKALEDFEMPEDDEVVELTVTNFFDAEDEVQDRLVEMVLESGQLLGKHDPLETVVDGEDEDMAQDEEGDEEEEEEGEEDKDEEDAYQYDEDAYVDLPDGVIFDL